MMICVPLAAVQMHESHDIHVGEVPMVEDIGWHEVEVVRVPLELRIEVAVNISKVAKLVHQSWTISEPLEFACGEKSSENGI